MTQTDNEHQLEKLTQVLADSGTVLFIGSGISRQAGLPSWEELLNRIADFADSKQLNTKAARYEISDRNLTIAASYLQDLFRDSDTELADYFRVNTEFEDVEPVRVHRVISSLGLTSFITTNYDQLIERAYASETGAENLKTILNTDASRLPELYNIDITNFIFKIHGDIDSKESLVIASYQYDNIIHGSPLVGRILEHILTNRNVVMLGVGLRDPDLDYFLKRVKHSGNRNKNKLIALTEGITEEARRYYLNSYDLEAINYKKLEESFEILVTFLEEVAGRISDLKSNQKVVLGIERKHVSVERKRAVLAEYEEILQQESSTRDIILSSLHWKGPSRRLELVESVRSIDERITEDQVSASIRLMLEHGVLREVAERIYPVDPELAEIKGTERIEDALLLGDLTL